MTMTREELKTAAAAVAQEMAEHTLTPELRARFVAIRAALFQKGVFDPVLARFDSATVAPADTHQTAAQLAKVADSLT
jgi:hypothetical protein